MKKNSEKILIFDTTLRDGDQSAGASMSVEDKLLIARNLNEMKVDIIEAGFPFASKGDFEAVKKISEISDYSEVCALARAQFSDLDAAGKALEKAKKSRIHTFISTSELHMKYKLKMNRSDVIEAIKKRDTHKNIMRPGLGVGGYCLTKDPRFIEKLYVSAIINYLYVNFDILSYAGFNAEIKLFISPPLIITNSQIDHVIEALKETKKHMLKFFGKEKVKLGEFQKLVRGSKEIPIFGLRDVITAMSSVPYKKGKTRVTAGESYIELIKFTEDGPEIESVISYGSSDNPDSPHFDDQMEIYSLFKTKKMSLKKEKVLLNAKKIYNPK